MGKRRKTIRVIKGLVIIIVIGTVAVAAAVLLANITVNKSTARYTYDDPSAIPGCEAALVLGASQYLGGGRPNLYFKYRIEAAAELYKSGKVKYLVVSGDNSRKDYNEPEDMKRALILAGVPAEAIFLDYAGFRTLDSVVRMKEIFSQERFIIVSQKFHNQRAVFIARRYGLETYGYNARDVDAYSGFKTNVREKFARVKVFIDLATSKKPKFLGEKVELKHGEANDLTE